MTPLSLHISKLNLFKQEAVFQSGINSEKSSSLCHGSILAMKNFEAVDFSVKTVWGWTLSLFTPEESMLLPGYVNFKSALCPCHFSMLFSKVLNSCSLQVLLQLSLKVHFCGELYTKGKWISFFPCHAAASQDSKPLGKQCLLFCPGYCSYVL